MTDSPTADIPRDSRTAEDVIDTIAEGQFYEDYDQSTGDLGILRALLSERDELRAQLQAARDLYEALENMVWGFKELNNNIDCGEEYDAYQSALAALAKARGEQ